MTGELAGVYKSGRQGARIVTETWGAANLYCPNCPSPTLDWLTHNTKANDYRCPKCEFWYQLKSKKSQIGNLIPCGAYTAIMEALESNCPSNYFLLHYNSENWRVRNLLLIPHFAIPRSAIIERKPTTPKGRSKPWIGCNITLKHVPLEARIAVVTESQVAPEKEVREKFGRIKPLKEIPMKKRGWMLDILNIVHRLGKLEFTNQDVYVFERELEKLHPGNRHIRDKIRQQLQNLAKAGLLIHAGRNDYRLVK